ncbi:hypothetical protein GOODEAATRI_003972 [Goodea atripinnis]|uniref:IMD domain-containing protein n=1 Tax=Goodea atripinnis TaxID=208336 RepID=A0ABV0PB81_9TELE
MILSIFRDVSMWAPILYRRGDLQPQLDSAMQDVSDKYLLLEETEKQAVRRALVEERSRFCVFVSMLRPVVDEEMSMLGEITHLQTLTDDLKTLTMDPHKLPASSEQVIVDLKSSECTWSYQTPPSSPSTTDWAKPGPYDQPMVNTLRRSKDRRETTDPSSHQGSDVTTPVDEPQGIKGNHTVMSPKGDKEVHEELARALARGLQLDIHGSSRDSLQGSSGYSSQTNTPCCSEDTILSQVSDCDYYSVSADQEGEHQSDFDKSSTIPRNSDITQSYRRMFQSKRPASTAGLPSNHSATITPGVATIRRTPSSKPNLRRPSGGLSLGPIPIKPPMIPVKTPTVPEHPGFSSRAEEGNTLRSPLSPPTTPLSPKSVAWGNQQLDEGLDPPTPPLQHGGRLSEWERRPLPELLEETEYCEVEDFLVAIRQGVKLKKTTSNDRSAPIIH